ncbi:hypothetical protein HJFPF1_00227 [Paramyrothecium foliicola]|nr:hypothetical protein HJFPF1_00227 [Paramyrothecium foliicola]
MSNCEGCDNGRKHVAAAAVTIDSGLQAQRHETPEPSLGAHTEALADAALHGVIVLGLVVEVPTGRRVGHLVGVLGAEPELGHLTALHGAEHESDQRRGDSTEEEARGRGDRESWVRFQWVGYQTWVRQRWLSGYLLAGFRREPGKRHPEDVYEAGRFVGSTLLYRDCENGDFVEVEVRPKQNLGPGQPTELVAPESYCRAAFSTETYSPAGKGPAHDDEMSTVDDAHISVRFKHGIHTIYIFVDALAPFSSVTQELVELLRDRYPAGLTSSIEPPKETSIPSGNVKIAYGVLNSPRDPSRGWKRLNVGDDESFTPTKCGIENNSIVAFTFVSDDEDDDEVLFEVEWPTEAEEEEA